MKSLHIFWGKVKKGKQRGRLLGFPTANINLHQNIASGIYISTTKLSKKSYPSLTFIGDAKTFNEKEYLAESYILNFNQNIYGQTISINLLKKIRENKKFLSQKDLQMAMENDKKVADLFFAKSA